MLQEQKQSKSQALDQRFQSTAMATAQTPQAAAGPERDQAATRATKAEPGAAAAVMGHWADDGLDGAANAKSEEDKDKPRVEGVFASTVLTWLGEPPWQVATDKEDRSQDRMKVLHCSLWAAKPPDWYQETGPRNLGHKVVGPNFVQGGWNVLTSANGLYHCAYVDLVTGKGCYFIVDYQAPKQRSARELKEQQLNGVQYTAYTGMRMAQGLINFISPGDNILEAVTGKNLNVFDEGFGSDVSWEGRLLKLVLAVAEVYGVKGMAGVATVTEGVVAYKALPWPTKLALLITCAAEAGGDPLIDAMIRAGWIDGDSAEYARIIVKLAGLSGAFAKLIQREPLDLLDYLGSISALAGGSDQTAKAVLGEEGYKSFWVANFGTISFYLQNGDKFAGALNLMMSSGGVLLKKLRK